MALMSSLFLKPPAHHLSPNIIQYHQPTTAFGAAAFCPHKHDEWGVTNRLVFEVLAAQQSWRRERQKRISSVLQELPHLYWGVIQDDGCTTTHYAVG